ncbi:hypothetical protein [Cupriavidus gilardii]|uniref:hypothetical protein n=1 Tax=Cupriavidus gilardii TaxID=82541 RepID=UPI0009EB8436
MRQRTTFDPAFPASRPRRRSRGWLMMATAALLLSACGGDDDDDHHGHKPPPPQPVAGCELNGTTGGEVIVLPGEPGAPEVATGYAPKRTSTPQGGLPGDNDPLVKGLRNLGHTVSVGNQSSGLSAIVRETIGGAPALVGGADPRREGVVLGDTFRP